MEKIREEMEVLRNERRAIEREMRMFSFIFFGGGSSIPHSVQQMKMVDGPGGFGGGFKGAAGIFGDYKYSGTVEHFFHKL